MTSRRGSVALFAGLAAVMAARDAAAVEREHGISLGAGASILDVSDKGSASAGVGGALAYSYGLSDAFNFLAEASWSVVALNETVQNAPTMVSTLNAGAAYVFDVIRWVPYIGLLLGTSVMSGGGVGDLKFVPDATVALGFDYRFDRTWSAGFAVRQYVFTDPGTYPSYTQAFARVGYVWGW